MSPLKKKGKGIISDLMELQFTTQKVKGKFSPIALKSGIQKVTEIYKLNNPQQNLPLIIFSSKNNEIIGIELARHSSDFLVRLTAKIIKLMRDSHIHEYRKTSKLMQYPILQSKGITEVKLILFEEFKDKVEFLKILEYFTIVREKFRKNLDKLSTLAD